MYTKLYQQSIDISRDDVKLLVNHCKKYLSEFDYKICKIKGYASPVCLHYRIKDISLPEKVKQCSKLKCILKAYTRYRTSRFNKGV